MPHDAPIRVAVRYRFVAQVPLGYHVHAVCFILLHDRDPCVVGRRSPALGSARQVGMRQVRLPVNQEVWFESTRSIWQYA